MQKNLLQRVDELSRRRPVSEIEYANALTKIIQDLQAALLKTEGSWTRKLMNKQLSIFKDELKKISAEFIGKLPKDVYTAIETDVKKSELFLKSVIPSEELKDLWAFDEESLKNAMSFTEMYFHRENSKGEHIHTMISLDDALKSVGNKVYNDAKSTMISGVATGANPNSIVSQIGDIDDVAAHNLRTIVRTIMADSQNRTQMKFLKENQRFFENYEYVAKLDSRTTILCRDTDGKIWDKFDDIPKDYVPPLHPNCRSIIVGNTGLEINESAPKVESNEVIIAYHGRQSEMGDFYNDQFFTSSPEWAEQYAGRDTRFYPNKKNSDGTKGVTEVYFMKGGRIAPVEINIKRKDMLIVSKADTKHSPEVEKQIIEQAKKDGYSGLIIKYEGVDREDYVVFKKEDVVSIFKKDTIAAPKAEEPTITEPDEPVVEKHEPEPDDYRMDHRAPGPEGNNSGDDVSDIYGDDIYSSKARQYYGMGPAYKDADNETLSVMDKMRGNPEQEITIYRSVPTGIKTIYEGDWITLSKIYADQHGWAYLEEGYDVITKKVKAKEVFTSGDGLPEWGYYPQ